MRHRLASAYLLTNFSTFCQHFPAKALVKRQEKGPAQRATAAGTQMKGQAKGQTAQRPKTRNRDGPGRLRKRRRVRRHDGRSSRSERGCGRRRPAAGEGTQPRAKDEARRHLYGAARSSKRATRQARTPAATRTRAACCARKANDFRRSPCFHCAGIQRATPCPQWRPQHPESESESESAPVPLTL